MKQIPLLFVLLFAASMPAFGQTGEIIVTTRKNIDAERIPGVVLIKRGDFLLLEVILENDTRETELRGREFNQTLANIFTAAEQNSDVELAVNLDDVVLPLSEQTQKYRLTIGGCGRPDTSCANLLLKTPLPQGDVDSEILINRLEVFAEGIEKVGRTSIRQIGGVEISVVDPNQYRGELLDLILEEINKITNGLGEGHKVKLQDVDNMVQFARSGILDVVLFIPYYYEILPDVRYRE